MSYAAEILADSISPGDVRLTTLSVTFPRFILAEINTHRVLSKNSASSRAIPPETHIQRVIEHPFVPDFGSRVTGMGEGPLDARSQKEAKRQWLLARDLAVATARALNKLNIDKSRINRLIEPFMWHTAIISGTEWSNFFALRTNEGAQAEFREIAALMRAVMLGSIPVRLDAGEWHTPLVPADECADVGWETAKKLSASRCARVSYDKQHDSEDAAKSLVRHDRLMSSGHLSPFEHVATPNIKRPHAFTLNFRGWQQYRFFIPYQDDYGARPQ